MKGPNQRQEANTSHGRRGAKRAGGGGLVFRSQSIKGQGRKRVNGLNWPRGTRSGSQKGRTTACVNSVVKNLTPLRSSFRRTGERTKNQSLTSLTETNVGGMETNGEKAFKIPLSGRQL